MVKGNKSTKIKVRYAVIKKEILRMKKNTLINKQIVENICNETHNNTLTGDLQKEIKLLSLKPNEGNK
jgi:hypothetical protein